MKTILATIAYYYVYLRISDTPQLCSIKLFIYILAIIYSLSEDCVLKQCCLMISFVLMLITRFDSGICGTIKLILIIADFHCMLQHTA